MAVQKLNKKDLLLQLQPYYENLLKAESESEILLAVLKLIEQEEKLPINEKKRLEEMQLNTAMGRHKRKN